MKLNEYQDMSQRTMPVIGDVTDPDEIGSVRVNYGLGVAGESGEVADLIKKQVFHGHEVDANKVMKELGDVMHYAAGLATLYGFTLEEVAQENIKKLQRRYPNGFSEEASRERVE